MSQRPVNFHLLALENAIQPLRERLLDHPLYGKMKELEDVRIFMQHHVFAVWDFMSLLKALQQKLTSTSEAWVPSRFPSSRRLINEIVLGEESDVDINGSDASHYEMYLQAMKQAGADIQPVVRFIGMLARGFRIPDILRYNLVGIPPAALPFLRSNYRLVRKGGVHELASAFTFGREDLIPDIFTALVKDLNREHKGKLDAFVYYLERHIEVDGDDHGPKARKMIVDLCGQDEEKWEDATQAAKTALEARIALWDALSSQISTRKEDLVQP